MQTERQRDGRTHGALPQTHVCAQSDNHDHHTGHSDTRRQRQRDDMMMNGPQRPQWIHTRGVMFLWVFRFFNLFYIMQFMHALLSAAESYVWCVDDNDDDGIRFFRSVELRAHLIHLSPICGRRRLWLWTCLCSVVIRFCQIPLITVHRLWRPLWNWHEYKIPHHMATWNKFASRWFRVVWVNYKVRSSAAHDEGVVLYYRVTALEFRVYLVN